MLYNVMACNHIMQDAVLQEPGDEKKIQPVCPQGTRCIVRAALERNMSSFFLTILFLQAAFLQASATQL